MRAILKKDKRGSSEPSALKSSEQRMLDAAGFKHRPDVKRDFFNVEDTQHEIGDFEVVGRKASDALRVLDHGQGDVSVVGFDQLVEHHAWRRESGLSSDIVPVSFINAEKCRLSFAMPKDSELILPEGFDGKFITTSFGASTRAWLAGKGVEDCTVEGTWDGGLETNVSMGLSDGIADIVESGTSLKLHDLEERGQILKSCSVLVARSQAMEDPEVLAVLERFDDALLDIHGALLDENRPEVDIEDLKFLEQESGIPDLS